jgi:hypothetical protein
VANAQLKVAGFSAVCRGLVRAAGKGLTEKQLKVEGLSLKGRRERRLDAPSGWPLKRLVGIEWREEEKDNAETLRTQRFRREEGDVGRGCKAMFTVYVTASRDNLSSYLLYSNDSNGVYMVRKLIRGMGMHGNLVRENGVCVRHG